MTVPKNAGERAVALRKLLAHHAHCYYTLDAPEISDEAYDGLYHELQALEERYPELAHAESVTRRVVGEAVEGLVKVRHAVGQWSFGDAFTEDDIRAFDTRVQKLLGHTSPPAGGYD